MNDQPHDVVRLIMAFGPRRVVVNADGDVEFPRQALDEHGVTPEVIFVRNDGWALGAPHRFAKVAYSMVGPEGWLAVIEPRPIGEYSPPS